MISHLNSATTLMHQFRKILSLILSTVVLTSTCSLYGKSPISVSFMEGSTMSGDLAGLSFENGLLLETTKTPNSPLALKIDTFKTIDFVNPPTNSEPLYSRLVLQNGDILPGNLSEIDENLITFSSIFTSDLEVPRSQAKLLRLGVRPQKLVFHGPLPLSEWDGNGRENWGLPPQSTDNSIYMDVRGQLSRDFDLPEQFIIEFKLSWDRTPSFRMSFAKDPDQKNSPDLYYIDINSAGLQMKRQTNGKFRWYDLIKLSHNELNKIVPLQEKELDVQIQVNRRSSHLSLFLNGDLVRRMSDPVEVPQGNSILIERTIAPLKDQDDAMILSEFKVYAWDAVSELEITEAPSDGINDIIVSSHGERISGKLLDFQSPPSTDDPLLENPLNSPRPSNEIPIENSPKVFRLNSALREEPLVFEEEKALLVYFKETQRKDAATDFPLFQIDTVNDGILNAKSITMDGQNFVLEHPLLGTLRLPHRFIKKVRFYHELH